MGWLFAIASHLSPDANAQVAYTQAAYTHAANTQAVNSSDAIDTNRPSFMFTNNYPNNLIHLGEVYKVTLPAIR